MKVTNDIDYKPKTTLTPETGILSIELPTDYETLGFIKEVIYKAMDPIAATLKIVPNHGNTLQLKNTLDLFDDIYLQISEYRLWIKEHNNL